MPSSTFRLIVLKKKTTPEPAAVMNQVKQVASRAWIIGLKPVNLSIIIYSDSFYTVTFSASNLIEGTEIRGAFEIRSEFSNRSSIQ